MVDTLFGRIAVTIPRWRACHCRAAMGSADCHNPGWTSALLGSRATPELVRLGTELGARLSFLEAGHVVALFLPLGAAASLTNVRRRVAKVAEQLQAHDDASPHRMSRAAVTPLVVSLDGAYVRAAPGFQARHFEIRTGWVSGNARPTLYVKVGKEDCMNDSTERAAARYGYLLSFDVVTLSIA